MVQFKATADRLGMTLHDADQLIRGRAATAGIAARLGLTMGELDDFVQRGAVSAGMGKRLGLGTRPRRLTRWHDSSVARAGPDSWSDFCWEGDISPSGPAYETLAA